MEDLVSVGMAYSALGMIQRAWRTRLAEASEVALEVQVVQTRVTAAALAVVKSREDGRATALPPGMTRFRNTSEVSLE